MYESKRRLHNFFEPFFEILGKEAVEVVPFLSFAKTGKDVVEEPVIPEYIAEQVRRLDVKAIKAWF